MTNSLFEKGETKTEGGRNRREDLESGSLLAVSLQAENRDLPVSQKLQYFGREMLNYKRQRERGLLRLQQQLVLWLEEKRRRREERGC